SRGRLIVQAPVGELIGRAASEVRVRSPDVERLHAALAAAGRRVVLDGSDRLRVADATTDEVGCVAFEAGVPVYELVADRGNLEAIFLELTEDQPVGQPFEQEQPTP
ncbi:MAG: ABC transporter ATP-binding protein, partial [Acidimicrobiales bacterium]